MAGEGGSARPGAAGWHLVGRAGLARAPSPLGSGVCGVAVPAGLLRAERSWPGRPASPFPGEAGAAVSEAAGPGAAGERGERPCCSLWSLPAGSPSQIRRAGRLRWLCSEAVGCTVSKFS